MDEIFLNSMKIVGARLAREEAGTPDLYFEIETTPSRASLAPTKSDSSR
jgi:hypothetical protein